MSDKEKRMELINKAIRIPFEQNSNLKIPLTVNETQAFYKRHFSEYKKFCILPWKKYIASEFWFNDAGFQFKWRNHKNIIQLECIP